LFVVSLGFQPDFRVNPVRPNVEIVFTAAQTMSWKLIHGSGWDADDFIPDDSKEKWGRLVKEFTVEFWAYKPMPNATSGIKGEFFGFGSYEIGVRNVTMLDAAVFVISVAVGPTGPTAYLYGGSVDWVAYEIWKAGEVVVKRSCNHSRAHEWQELRVES
jgi:hypothetical protein